MTPEFVIGFARQSIELTLVIALPMLGVGLGVGVLVSVLQAATQIQEMTLSFVPKLAAIFIALGVSGPWIITLFTDFMRRLYAGIPHLIG